jgi:cobaltochelatase CobT
MSGPFPERNALAVGACTRALALSNVERGPALSRVEGLQSARAATVDSAFARAQAATLSGLRAIGDRLAIAARHHDATVHHIHRPPVMPASSIFEGLELARLDALGVRWLAGVAKNLMAHPGAENDGVRWLAFEALSGRTAPREKTPMVAAVKVRLEQARLKARLYDDLVDLSGYLDDQESFAKGAAAWARTAAQLLPKALIAPAETGRLQLPRREVVRDLPRRGDPGATSAPLSNDTRDDEQQDSEGTATGNAGTTGAGTRGYRAFTTAHDRIVDASSLASRDELVSLRAQLEGEFGSVRSLVARLAKRLMRALMARQVREWRFDLDEGVLDGSRLATLVASGGRARPFKQESDSPFPATVVSLLIDHSGSMRGRPMLIAALTVEIFARVLERCGVKCEVLGFTTREWNGGEPAREWAAHGYQENPGRLNALEHIVIKSADVPWRRARVGLGLFLHEEMLKENIDGEALQWAHQRLLSRSEPRRILLVVSDGTPMDEATLAANGHEYLESHLQTVAEDIERRSRIRLAAIGIGHNVSAIYSNATTIASIDQLGPAITNTLMALLAE